MIDIIKGVSVFVLLVVILVICGRVYQYFYGSNNSGGGSNGSVITVTPVPITPEVLAQLPIGQTASTMIDIPKPEKPNLGYVNNQSVVVTDKGNTLVINTQSLVWGFKCEPKIYGGVSDTLFVGVGMNVFTVWRINTDIFVGTSINEFLKVGYLGAGLSYQVLDNTYIGAAVLGSTEGEIVPGAYVSLKF